MKLAAKQFPVGLALRVTSWTCLMVGVYQTRSQYGQLNLSKHEEVPLVIYMTGD